ncbi:Phosphate transport system regulatory protein PhoU [uncultured delta proteobacterium]|uniref:Phosphate-specific transport system accessory protein PhoU n=1 Tax=uncultured delta proteobacterium TaxID=34034 RepID=A0A212K658_9DELT|nr:Phosphate transport system regulatory protein PhoU [uncultured delta proteobacterium]
MHEKETQLQQMLTQLRTKLLMMGAAVGIALDEACTALEEGNLVRAAAVVDGDAAINAMENEIDELALSILVRNQPVAHDLRFVVGALRMVIDLERIGDEAASIAERTVTMEKSLPTGVMQAAGVLMRSAISMYVQAMDAFRTANKDGALRLCRVDDEIARQEMAALQRVMEHFCGEPGGEPGEGRKGLSYEGMNGILICRSLNRVCRRCANIAEHTYFVVEGVNIKHQTPAK